MAPPLAGVVVYARPVYRKLVVFVPPDALDAVRDALFAAGAGRIGDYERCSWYTEGTGTFLGGEGTEPVVGERGREERVPELTQQFFKYQQFPMRSAQGQSFWLPRIPE